MSTDQPADELVAATRAAIMDATIALISQSGLAGMRLQDIAAHAGLSVGGIQYHFSSRSDLVDQALQRHALESIEAITVDPAGLGAWPALERTLYAISERSELESRDRVWVMLNASALTTREHLRLVHAIQNRWRSVLSEAVGQGVASGEFAPSLPVAEVVERIVVMVDGYSMSNAVYGVDAGAGAARMGAALCDLAAVLLGVNRAAER